METTCNRCHQGVPAEGCYCPTCGLPQLVYSSEDGAAPVQPDRWSGALKDASSVEWKPALRAAILLAIPAGMLSCGQSPLSGLSLLWMAMAAAWAVTLYVRRQRPAWITMGAGARIGLVTGIVAGWLALSASGAGIWVERFLLHQGDTIDQDWKTRVELSTKLSEQLFGQMGITDTLQLQMQKQLELTSEGHAGVVLAGSVANMFFFVLLAAFSGAMSARFTGRPRPPEA